MFSIINNVLFELTSNLNYYKPMSQSAPVRLLGRDPFESFEESHFFQQSSFNSTIKYPLFPIVQILHFPMALILHQRPLYKLRLFKFPRINFYETMSR